MPLLVARCDCGETLEALPVPEIEVRDPVSGRTNDDPKNNDDGNTPLVLDFGAQEVGARATAVVEVKNTGNELLRVTNITFAPADPTDTICPVPSSAITFNSGNEQRPREVNKDGGTDTITVAYTAEAGSHCRVLLIRSDDADEATVKVYFTASGTGPKLCAVPDNGGIIDFGTSRPTVAKQKTQRIESCGTRAVRVTDLAIQDGLTQAFRIVSPTAAPNVDMPPCDGTNAATCGVDVVLEFNPPAGGVYQSVLNVTTTSALGATVYPFQLTGKGAECNLQVVPTTVQFGAVAANQTASQTVLLRSIGVCHCQVDSISAIMPDTAGFTMVSPPTTPFVLRGTDGCDGDPAPDGDDTNTQVLQVQYAPGNRTTASVDNASFHVLSASNTSAPDVTVNLEATGGGTPRCELVVNPALPAMGTMTNPFDVLPEGQDTYKRYGLVRFGNTIANNTKRMPVTFTNRGNTNCTISAVAWDNAATATHGFGLQDANNTPMTVGGNPNLSIAPGDTLTLKATYKPAAAGEKWNGAAALDFGQTVFVCGFGNQCAGNGIKFTTNAQNIDTTAIGGGPGVISFGFNGASVAPAIDVIPGEVDFGLVTLGCGSEEREVKIYNTGNADLVVVDTKIAPVANPVEFRITASPVPPTATVQPGQSIRIKVRFYPRRVGEHSGNLVITTDAGDMNYDEYTVPLRGEGTTESSVVDVFQQLSEPQVDVLWVVDDSGSMSDEQQALADNFPSFFSSTSINNVDYHIAVTTTLYSEEPCFPDFSNPLNSTCSVTPDPKAGWYTACPGNDKFITRTTANPQAQFACNVEVGDPANVSPDRPQSSSEAGLAAAKIFLSEPNVSDPNINGGFLRDDAKLYVIIVSDEEDYSEGPTDLYVDFFQNLKGFRNRNLVSVSAIAGRVPGGCGEAAQAGERYKDAVDGIANGVFHDICTADWGAQLQSLAFDSFGLRSQFFLSRNADPAQLQVCVATQDPVANPGATCTPVAAQPEGAATGYFYESSTNSVVFNSGSVPPRGNYVKVTYEAFCFPTSP